MTSRDLHVSDEVFVRARRRDVHRYLADVASYGAWWPGCRSAPLAHRPGPRGGGRLVLRPPSRRPVVDALRWGRAGTHRLRLEVTKERCDLGLHVRLRGDLDGEGEWYYLDEVDGTVVHWLVRARARGGRPVAVADVHRAALRAGMNALKDLLEAGRAPGDEPTAALLADQQDAIAEFRAGVEAHQRAFRGTVGGGAGRPAAHVTQEGA